MSLTSLLRNDHRIAKILDSFIRPGLHKIEFATLVPSRDKANAPLIGTAVDYAIRIELERRWPNAKERAWIAEDVKAKDAVPNGAKIVRGAKRFSEEYRRRRRGSPSQRTLRALARWCLDLAEVDFAYRAPTEYVGADIDHNTVDEVVDIFRACPWDKVLALRKKQGEILLNPTFGNFSEMLGGADADLIVGQTLIDIKTVLRPSLDKFVLRQLSSYFFCATGCHVMGGDIPPIDSVGVLFPRQSDLWVAPVEDIFDMRNLTKLSTRFFNRASQVRRERRESLKALRVLFGTA